ncbi:MAG: OmpA family protein [Desulfamplus sp.]|nr:OmpA family protein [Desulfamplus sp.]MBF0411771.1 OmpA family protein [Desulfamplus sp.]
MKNFISKSLFIAVAMVFMVGCAAQGPKKPFVAFAPNALDGSQYSLKHDNFLVILDGSSSMEEMFDGNPKFDIAKEFVGRMNQTLPELGQIGGLRSFGHKPSVSPEQTKMLYGMEVYSTQVFAAGLAKLSGAGGNSPLYRALAASIGDIDGKSGTTALVIVSDFKDLSPKTAVTAQALKDKFGDTLCIYPVIVGDNKDGKALMQTLSDIGGCGFVTDASQTLSSAEMANFVQNAFLAGSKPVASAIVKDSDNDGVPDDRDKCPDTPPGVEVDADGCPLDTDGDGVPDYLDKCPGTPIGAKVNPMGCWVLGDLLFDFDKSDIKPSGYAELNNVVDILSKNPNLRVDIQGHTDSKGSDAYNQALSMRRAQSVKVYLANKGISADRMKCEGYGESMPAASNDTEFGRSLNRRVQLMPIK